MSQHAHASSRFHECRSIVGVLGLGFTAKAQASDSVMQESIFMVTELCSGGSLREKVLAQMVAGRRKAWFSLCCSKSLQIIADMLEAL